MLQWVYNSNGGAIPWHTRLLLLASAAALAPTLAPLVLSLRVTISTSSTLALAWTAVLAQIPAPTALSFPRTNPGIHKNLVSCAYGVFCCLFYRSTPHETDHCAAFVFLPPLPCFCSCGGTDGIPPVLPLAAHRFFFYNGEEMTGNEVNTWSTGNP